MIFADEDEPPGTPSVRPWLISCDESGTGGARYYGFGTLWMPWDRRGGLIGDVRQIAADHGIVLESGEGALHEFKWTKVRPHRLNFYRAIVEYFFRRTWLLFHCIVVCKADVEKEAHRGGLDEARRKHFALLLTNKVDRALRHEPTRKFRVWVDPLPSRQAKADEAAEIISNRVLHRKWGCDRAIDKIITRQSHETLSIQICDVLLGAVLAAWQGEVEAPAKLALQRSIAEHIGWTDLRADTIPDERKFNVWFLCDPNDRPAGVQTRAVSLKYPLAGCAPASRSPWVGSPSSRTLSATNRPQVRTSSRSGTARRVPKHR